MKKQDILLFFKQMNFEQMIPTLKMYSHHQNYLRVHHTFYFNYVTKILSNKCVEVVELGKSCELLSSMDSDLEFKRNKNEPTPWIKFY